MRVFETEAETRLAEAIAHINPRARDICLYLPFSRNAALGDSALIPQAQEAARRLATTQISAPEAQIYLCQDGDVFIIAPDISPKAARHLIAAIAQHLNISSDGLAEFYPLGGHARMIAEMAAEKQKRRAIAQQILAQQKITAQKREQILHPVIATTLVKSIAARRANRYAPQLMMIEDDVFSRHLVEALLMPQYKITAMADAATALATYAELTPDILFLDIGLPDVSGHELLEHILEMDPDAFVIMFSAHNDFENVTRALEIGAKGFIAKPFTREKIMQYIQRCPTLRH